MLHARAIWGAALAAIFAGPSVAADAPYRPLPTGAKIEISGFATIEVAPATPAHKPVPDNRPTSEAGFYALDNGITQAEAMKRIAEQHAFYPSSSGFWRPCAPRKRPTSPAPG